MKLSEYSDDEIIKEIQKRGIRVHIDSVNLSIYMHNIEIGEVKAI